MLARTANSQRAKALVERVMALDQPWRGRVIKWVTSQVISDNRSEELPAQLTPTTLETWLCDRPQLLRDLTLILNAWDPGEREPLMKSALANGVTVYASTNAPKVAVCPVCDATVDLRSRDNGNGHKTWYYRHRRGEGLGCSRRAGRPGEE